MFSSVSRSCSSLENYLKEKEVTLKPKVQLHPQPAKMELFLEHSEMALKDELFPVTIKLINQEEENPLSDLEVIFSLAATDNQSLSSTTGKQADSVRVSFRKHHKRRGIQYYSKGFGEQPSLMFVNYKYLQFDFLYTEGANAPPPHPLLKKPYSYTNCLLSNYPAVWHTILLLGSNISNCLIQYFVAHFTV